MIPICGTKYWCDLRRKSNYIFRMVLKSTTAHKLIPLNWKNSLERYFDELLLLVTCEFIQDASWNLVLYLKTLKQSAVLLFLSQCLQSNVPPSFATKISIKFTAYYNKFRNILMLFMTSSFWVNIPFLVNLTCSFLWYWINLNNDWWGFLSSDAEHFKIIHDIPLFWSFYSINRIVGKFSKPPLSYVND